ncbi:MAG TPA: hypothetical protein DCF45_03710 [Gammaproteobacteria bacterium]|nr:hypothetical protein [Gammaproteobacteria bacterium]
MTIRGKLLIGAMVLAALPVLLSSGITGWQSYRSAKEALVDQSRERLISMREIKKSQVERAFASMSDQILSLAQSRMTIDAMVEFERNYLEFQKVVTPSELEVSQQRSTVNRFYQQQFLPTYAELNAGATLPVEQYFRTLDKDGLAVQYHYLASTEFGIEAKEQFDKALDGTGYTWFHGDFHPILRDYKDKFDYYDVYFIEPEKGVVTYSVRKEIDYGTSLLNGSFAQSNLAAVFRQAMAIDSHDEVAITDMGAYIPSFGRQSVFMAVPVFEGRNKVGVLAFQISAQKIGAMMTDGERWQDIGLSRSGENYLVGSDGLMRSPSRFMIEQPDIYLQNVAGDDVRPLIAAQQSTVGLQKVNTQSVSRGLAGDTGFMTVDGYAGEAVMSAYSTIDVPGLNWAVVSEIAVQDTLAAATGLRNEILVTSATIVVLMLLAGGGLGGFFARSITRPLVRIVEAMDDIAEGEGDLTRRLDDSGSDEVSALARGFNTFIGKIDRLVADVAQATTNLVQQAHSLEEVTVATHKDVNDQRAETEQLSNAMAEVVGAVNAVTTSASEAAQAARDADSQAREGDQVVQGIVGAIAALEQDIQGTAKVIEDLNRESDAVGSVIDVISDIAEQTNLLALNAAIEAARAGEQGRGFAVVADEVRTLASRTQQSTEEIKQTVSRIQVGTESAVRVMEQSRDSAEGVVGQVNVAGESLSTITQAVGRISDMNEQIAGAAAQQSAVMENVNRNVGNINEIATRTEEGAQHTSASSQTVLALSDDLAELVGQFKSGSRS